MLLFSYLFLFCASLFLNASLVARALPAGINPPLLSISLSRATYGSSYNRSAYMHGSIVQQQHTNRGIKRLALMTGGIAPSNYELLGLLYQRISMLSPVHRDKFEIKKIEEILTCHNASLRSAPELLSSTLDSNTPGNATTRNSQAIHVEAVTSSSSSSSSLHTIGLNIESNDIGYVGNMNIGTPFKAFRLLIDSGSSDLWVGSTNCTSDDGGSCGNHNFLGPKSSASYVQTTQEWAIGYATGSVWGYIMQDVVSIAGLTIKNHTFGVAFNESSDFTGNDIPFDGLLGLAKSDISQQRVPTLLQALFQAKLIAAPIISYKIPRLADGKNDTGELTFGAMDPNHYYPKSLVTVKNVNKFGFWGTAVDAVKIGNHDMKWSNRTVVMDTGTTLIIAPQNDVQAIHNAIPGAQFDGNGWTVPCNMTTVLSLTIGGKSFTVDPRDIAFYPVEEGSRTCISGIGIGGVPPFYQNTDWLVGDVFLKNVYFSTDEDKDEISIAKPLY